MYSEKNAGEKIKKGKQQCISSQSGNQGLKRKKQPHEAVGKQIKRLFLDQRHSSSVITILTSWRLTRKSSSVPQD